MVVQGTKIWSALAGVNGFMAVAVGAFAAHGVKDAGVQALLHTGSQYQALHAVAALACFSGAGGASPTRLAGGLFGVGGLIFGGSLYVLAMTGVKLWGAVTPIGGLLLLAGWATVVWGASVGRTPGKS